MATPRFRRPALEAPPDLWQNFLARFPTTTRIDVVLPDLNGVPRGKRLSRAAFEAALPGGLSFATSLYALDTTGANVDASGLVWEEGDADRPCLLDMATLAPMPWRDGGAQVLGGLGEPDGTSFFADPRALLRKVATRFAPLGLRPVCALELEFYLLASGGGHVRPRAAARRIGPREPGEIQVYSLDEIDAQERFFSRLEDFCLAQEVPLKSVVSEYAPGQFEANLGHVADALRAADHAFLLKRAIRAAARTEGLGATFMAKPFENQAPNGLHVHVSLIDATGANAFSRDPSLLDHAIGGLKATMAEAMLFCAPNANSYRRLRPLSYAPLAPTWGHNNRTVALRVPAGPAAARRIEHRVAGADTNPYLVLAAVLAGIHFGLAQRLDPGPPSEGNAYTKVEPSLPRTWEAAIRALAEARVLPEYLGGRLCDLYNVCRAAERERFSDVVTPTEHAWYLRTV